MLRLCMCAALALVIGSGAALAEEKKAKPKKPAGQVGQVVSFDGKTLTLKVKKEEKKFEVAEGTVLIIAPAKKGDKPEKTTVGSSGKEKLVAKARVRVTVDDEGKVTNVRVLPARKPKTDKAPKGDK